MKIVNALFSAAVTAALLSACGSSGTTDGVKQMKDTLADLQRNIDAGDASKVKTGAGDLETEWKKFEEDVKKQHADLYQKIEDPLHNIEAGSDAAQLDKTALGNAANELKGALDELDKASK